MKYFSMKNLVKWSKKNRLVLGILVLAFLIRVMGIYFDYPGVRQISDESYHISFIVKALNERSLFPDVILQYPLLLTLLYFPVVILKLILTALVGGFFSVTEIKDFLFTTGMGQLIIITRWFSVLFGTATVYLVYKLVEQINKNKSAAILASLAYAFSLVPVYISHWGKMHSIMVFFLLLALYFVLRFERSEKIRWWFYSCLAASLSISVHYLGISAFIFPLAAWWLHKKEFKIKEVAKGVLYYLGPAMFFYLLNWRGVKWMVRENILNYYAKSEGAGLTEVGILERFYFVFRDSLLVEPVFAILGLLALVFTFKNLFRDKFKRYVLLGLGFNYLVMISIVAAPWHSRWLLPFISLLILLGSGYAVNLVEKIKSKNLKPLIYTALVLPAIMISAKWVWLLNTNTHIEAAKWIKSNIAPNKIVYSFDYKLELPLSISAAEWQVEENKVDSAKLKYIINNGDKFRGYNLYYDFGKNRFAELGGEQTNYVLFSFKKSEEEEEIIRKLNKYYQLKLAQGFKPISCEKRAIAEVGQVVNNPTSWLRIWGLIASGPNIQIYKISEKK